MSAWKKTQVNDIALWRGHLNCQDAHKDLLDCLRKICGWFHPCNKPITPRIQGNLGEFIAFRVGKVAPIAPMDGTQVITANCDAPLNDISKPDIDILWLYLPPENAAGDRCIVHEVKTTCQPTLEYCRTLIDDFEKLFGTDLQFTLQSRLQAAANTLANARAITNKEACRILRLTSTSPAKCRKVSLVPTVVHDLASESPERHLQVVKAHLLGKGWTSSQIELWSIALSELNSRLERLARGLP